MRMSLCVYGCVSLCLSALCARVCVCVHMGGSEWESGSARCEAHEGDAREGDNVAVQVGVHMHAQFGCLQSE